MNIALVLSQTEVTGAEVYAVALADALIEKGHTVWIISDTLTKSCKAHYIPLALHNRSWKNRFSHIAFLRRFIRQRQIHIIHAHSRASGWCAYFAARFEGIPLVTTVHGKQPTHPSRKILKAFGDSILPVCEAIRDNLIRGLGVSARKVRIVRNGVAPPDVPPQSPIKPTITLVGRLSKEKGELARNIVGTILSVIPDTVHVRVIGGTTIPDGMRRFQPRVEFTGYVDNPAVWMNNSTVVIGAGRSAIESVLLNKPTIAVGEARCHGLITPENLVQVITTNFGDIDIHHSFDAERLKQDILLALEQPFSDPEIRRFIEQEYSPELFLDTMLTVYQEVLVRRSPYKSARWRSRYFEIPILTYHRIVQNPADGGLLPIWVTVRQFERHLQVLQEEGFEPITFIDLLNSGMENRSTLPQKPVILTFDDGYEDNYTLLFPLLQRYGIKTTIFCVSSLQTNSWDSPKTTGLPALPLLTTAQMLEMQRYGVEFGSHTATHQRLTEILPEKAREEIITSKDIVEQRLGMPISTLCYPFGAVNERIKHITHEAGYRLGISSDSGPPMIHEDLMEIRRIGVFPNTGSRGFRRKISGSYCNAHYKQR